MSRKPDPSNRSELDEVFAQVQFLVDNPDSTLPRDAVLEFSKSSSLSVLGALEYLIVRADLAMRIAPTLSLNERQSILLRYWERCILENPPDDDFVGNRYVTALDVLNWWGSLWRDKSADHNLMLDMKHWLADLYRKGGDEVRTCIVQGLLETLFKDREIRRFFADWKLDPLLGAAYKEATN